MRRVGERWFILLVACIGSAIFSSFVEAQDLSLEQYLSQVREKHEGIQSATLSAEAAKKRAPESDLPLAWTLFSSVEQRNDHQTPLTLFFLQNNSTTYSLGLTKLTSFGLQARVATNAKKFTYIGLPPAYAAIIPFSTYWDISSGVEVTQSLWRNGFGRATRAQQQIEEASALSAYHKSNYARIQLLSQAQSAYWNAAASQQIIAIQKDNLKRAAKLVAWSKDRVSLNLADTSDLLQAEASYRLRELELLQSQSDLKNNARTFNSLRGIDSEEVSESLSPVYLENIEQTVPPMRAKFRQDVLAAQEDARAAESNAELGMEKNKPTLEAYANFYLNGRSPEQNSALALLGNGKYNLLVLGVRLNMPLEFGLLSSDKAAYVQERKAATLTLSRKQFEQESDWQGLLRRLDEGKAKLRLARTIEQIQKEKCLFEQRRLRRGKSTLFQVLQFESDLATSQQARIQRETEVRNVLNQMTTFGANS